MQTTNPQDNNKEEEKLPDFVEQKDENTGFGETDNDEAQQESFPDNGNQSQTGAATNNSKLDIEPNEDGDGSVVGPND